MGKRWAVLVVLVLSACATEGGERAPGGLPAFAPGSVLLLGSSDGIRSVDAGTGRVLSDAGGVAPIGDWGTVFSTTTAGDSTRLRTSDAATGEVLSAVRLDGDLGVRLASDDRVALMEPLAEGESPWVPEPRASTTIVVADPSGATDPVTYDLEGNFEPEAFSVDSRDLFLVRFVPPTDPVAYRVARLDLDTGRVLPVNTGRKGVVETMSGTRLEQIVSPDGAMLYTLYTTQSAAETGAHEGHEGQVAFVHTLSLDEGWAHCVLLPRDLWGADPADEAMALSPRGDLLYVADTARDLIAVMDTERLRVAWTHSFDFEPAAGADSQAVIAERTLFVASGRRVVAIDTGTLEPTERWELDGPVSALGSHGAAALAEVPGAVLLLDPAAEPARLAIPSAGSDRGAYVGLLDRTS